MSIPSAQRQHARPGGDLLSLFVGLALVFSYAPYGHYWLAPLLLAVQVWLWQDLSPRRAALRGWLFGFGLYGYGVWWVTISLHVYGGAPFAFAALAAMLLAAYLALYPALAGWLLNRFWPRAGAVRWLLALPALWLLLDWVRGWLLSGFPWLAPGYAQTDGMLAGFAPLGGVLLVGWAVLLSAGLLLLAWRGPWRALWPVLLVGLWLGGSQLQPLKWVEPVGEPLSVAMIQGNVDQRRKWEEGNLERTLLRYSALSIEAAEISEVIIWPETAIPLFVEYLDPEFRMALQAHARESQVDYLIGVPSGNLDAGEYFNAVMAVGDTGGLYRKHDLLPFGEYLPLRWLFDVFHRYVDIPMADFTRGGRDQPLLGAGGYPVGVSICFEIVFGNVIRRSTPEAAFLVNVSNDAWFGDSIAPAQHLQIARLRAIENRRWLARSTNTGITALIDPQGRIVERIPQFEIATLHGELIPMTGATPYARYGDPPVLVLLAGLLVLAGLRRSSTTNRQA